MTKRDLIADELLALRDADGIINPRTAVDWAWDNKKSALYAALDWDDAHAAMEHRVWQVRNLISIRISAAEPGRRLISLSIDRQTGGYRSLEDVRQRPDLMEIMLADALVDLERVQRRYQSVQALAEVWQAAAAVKTARERKRAA